MKAMRTRTGTLYSAGAWPGRSREFEIAPPTPVDRRAFCRPGRDRPRGYRLLGRHWRRSGANIARERRDRRKRTPDSESDTDADAGADADVDGDSSSVGRHDPVPGRDRFADPATNAANGRESGTLSRAKSASRTDAGSVAAADDDPIDLTDAHGESATDPGHPIGLSARVHAYASSRGAVFPVPSDGRRPARPAGGQPRVRNAEPSEPRDQ